MAFKPNTDDIREAPALTVIHLLTQAGAKLRCYDPKAGPNTVKEFIGNPNVLVVDDPYEALAGCDALIICTEWIEFRTPDFDRIRAQLAQRVIFDGRNLYDPQTMLRQRIEYHSIGRPEVKPVRSASEASPKYGC